jgi:hypothetical protein
MENPMIHDLRIILGAIRQRPQTNSSLVMATGLTPKAVKQHMRCLAEGQIVKPQLYTKNQQLRILWLQGPQFNKHKHKALDEEV